MSNYVNQEAFLRWYAEKAKPPLLQEAALLNDVARQYMETGRQEYVLAPEKTNSGEEERYPFRYENVGCCGASTYFWYF